MKAILLNKDVQTETLHAPAQRHARGDPHEPRGLLKNGKNMDNHGEMAPAHIQPEAKEAATGKSKGNLNELKMQRDIKETSITFELKQSYYGRKDMPKKDRDIVTERQDGHKGIQRIQRLHGAKTKDTTCNKSEVTAFEPALRRRGVRQPIVLRTRYKDMTIQRLTQHVIYIHGGDAAVTPEFKDGVCSIQNLRVIKS